MLVLNSFAEIPKARGGLLSGMSSSPSVPKTARQARAQRKAREKAKKEQRALAIKMAKARLEGRNVQEVMEKYEREKVGRDLHGVFPQGCGISFYILFQAEKEGDPEKNRELTPQEMASPVSQLLFTWMDHMIWAGFKAPLQMDQVPDVNRDMLATSISKKFETTWEKFSAKKASPQGEKNPMFDVDQEIGPKANGVEMVDIVEAAKQDEELPVSIRRR